MMMLARANLTGLFAIAIVIAGLVVLLAYFVGSIPFGYLIGRMKGVDIRTVGSGNIGATNIGRVFGKKWGYACFFLDMGKGLLLVLLVGLHNAKVSESSAQNIMALPQGLALPQYFPPMSFQVFWLLVGCAAILGHVFNIWLRFKGGKGVATALGVVLGVFPYFTYAGLAAFGIWIIITLSTRYVSVGSIVAAVAFVPLFVAFNLPLERVKALAPLGIFAAAMACLIIIKHRGNIKRLLNGTENKIGKNKTSVL